MRYLKGRREDLGTSPLPIQVLAQILVVRDFHVRQKMIRNGSPGLDGWEGKPTWLSNKLHTSCPLVRRREIGEGLLQMSSRR